jgi:hypothetical protein
MKTIFLQCIVFLSATFALWADDVTTFLPSNIAPDAKQKLEAFEKGIMTLKELTERDGNAGRQELIDYYYAHTDEVSVQVYSNDWQGWKVLGTAHMFMGSNNAAVKELTLSAKLGDDYSYAPLAFSALRMDRIDIVSNLVQHLLVLKKQEPPPEAGQLDIITVLTIYSLRADQRDVFVKTLEGVTAKQIFSRDDLPELVKKGCERFKGKEIDKIREEMASATGNNPNSGNTNSPSP